MRRLLGSVVVPVLLLAGCGARAGSPVLAQRPALTAGARPCAGLPRARATTHGWVRVDADPSGGIAAWPDRPQSAACRWWLTPISQEQAVGIAQAVRTAPGWPNATINCPSDSGTTVYVFLSYPGKTELAELRPTGCGSVTAPGRDSRQLNGALAPIAADAPRAWQLATGYR